VTTQDPYAFSESDIRAGNFCRDWRITTLAAVYLPILAVAISAIGGGEFISSLLIVIFGTIPATGWVVMSLIGASRNEGLLRCFAYLTYVVAFVLFVHFAGLSPGVDRYIAYQ
jgi:hypothetical protein